MLVYVYSVLGLFSGAMAWPVMLMLMFGSASGMVAAIAINGARPDHMTFPLKPAEEWSEKQRHNTLMLRLLIGLAVCEVACAAFSNTC